MAKIKDEKKKRVSFSQGLFWSVFSIFLGFTFCFLLFQYQREREYTQEKLNSVLSNYNYQIHYRCENTNDIDLLIRQFIDEIPQKELRITIIDAEGVVIYDSAGIDVTANHNDRSEVRLARQNKEGFAIRSSGSTGKRYFYSASCIDGYVYRSALPYDIYVKDILSINKDFIYFMAFMVLFFFFVLSRFTFSIGKTIAKLRDFTRNVEDGVLPETEYTFSNNELGDISRNVITLYHQQQAIKEDEIRRKRQLTQNVAHELKTPVSSIQGYLETIITNPEMSQEKKDYFLERCYSQSSRLTDLLRDISVLNRLDEASDMFELSDVHIDKLLAELKTECAKDMEEKKMTSDISIPTGTVIHGNYSLLYSIFRNLFDNAINYAGEGVLITIKCEREDDNTYYFSFADNGIGIDKQHVTRIFERFYRIDKGRSRKLGGTGLGLAIVKNGVLFHKGQISAQSSTGNGITFFFSLKKKL